MNTLNKMLFANLKYLLKIFGLFLSIFALCLSWFSYASNLPALADEGVWQFDKYGYTKPNYEYSVKTIATRFGFNENWYKYEAPAAIKAGKILDFEPEMIGAWTYSEGIVSVFESNCRDDTSTINKPCVSGKNRKTGEWMTGNDWQTGYGFQPFGGGWIDPNGQYNFLQKALDAMHPGESIHDIIVNAIQESKVRYDELYARYGEATIKEWPSLWRPQYLTNPAVEDVPENITVQELYSRGANADPNTYDPLYRQLVFVLVMDDEISAYCMGAVLKYYYARDPAIEMADRMTNFTSKQEMATALDYVSKLGLPDVEAAGDCTEERDNELYAIFTETTFYDTDDCDPTAASVGLGVSANGFVFPQKTTQAQLKRYDNSNWMTCTNPVSSMSNGTPSNPEQINGCHHDYLAADIFNETGTPVVAPRPGKIMRVEESTSSSSALMIHLYSDKSLGGDGLWYYFTHNLPGSNKVAVGDIVKAGDVLAEVGTRQNAEGSNPHTHFDISPSENYFCRGGCEVPDPNDPTKTIIPPGTGGPLLDPNPALKASYAALPEN